MDSKIGKFLGGVTLTSALGILGVGIHAPYLIFLGSADIPRPNTSTVGLVSAGLFAASFIIGLVAGYLASSAKGSWFALACAIAGFGAGACWAIDGVFGTEALKTLSIWFCWVISAIGTGWLVWRFNPLLKPSEQSVSGIMQFAGRLIPGVLGVLGSTVLYSLLVIPQIPAALGGIGSQPVSFEQVEKSHDLPMLSDHVSDVVTMLCQEGDSYWVSIPPDRDRPRAVKSYPVKDLGEFRPETISPPPPAPTLPPRKTRAWVVPWTDQPN